MMMMLRRDLVMLQATGIAAPIISTAAAAAAAATTRWRDLLAAAYSSRLHDSLQRGFVQQLPGHTRSR